MARVPMVTRTIITTKANVLCLDITTGQPFEKEVDLPRTYKDEAHLLKQVKKTVDTDTVKAVHVKSYKEVEALYGMTEQEFIAVAKELPPRAKADEAEVTDDAETETAPTDTVKAVHVKSYKELEALYGMTEQEFIAVAKELPPREKADEAEVTDDADTETEPKEN